MSTPLERAAAALSSRRSASRARILITLHDHDGAMLASELAHACGWDASRLAQVMYGDDDAFSVVRSPFALGQVSVHETPHGAMFHITPIGREEAGRLRREAAWERGRGRKRRHR